jgi:hypothetical protein
MPKRSGKKKDLNERAFSIVQQLTGEASEAEAAEKPGRPGGLKGGSARAKALTKRERSEIARLAAAARWKKR